MASITQWSRRPDRYNPDRDIYLWHRESSSNRVKDLRYSMLFKAVAETAGGAFSLMECELPVSNRKPQPHTDQGPGGFYVLEGSIESVVGGQSRIGGPRFWALVPSGVAQSFGNASDLSGAALQ